MAKRKAPAHPPTAQEMAAWPSLTGNYIPPDGPLDAKIVIIGESPWKTENRAGKPFKGPAGNMLSGWLLQSGLDRTKCLIHNVWPYYNGRKPATLTIPERTFWINHLRAWLTSLPSPHVIVPTGNLACYALLGKGGDLKGLPQNKKIGITSLRGSIEQFTDLNNRSLKVIPTLHPSHILQGGSKMERRTLRDYRRIAHESTFPEINAPKRHHDIEPSPTTINRYLEAAENPSTVMAIDIENSEHAITCVGFSYSPEHSATFPLTSQQHRDRYLPVIAKLCASPSQKVLQFGFHDAYWLQMREGIPITNYFFDLGMLHHAVHPRESHSLAFLASWYCPHYRFWKDEHIFDASDDNYASPLEALFTYNGMDCTYTRELFDHLHADLIKSQMLHFYHQTYPPLFEPLLSMMYSGVTVLPDRVEQHRLETIARLNTLRTRMTEIAGEDLWAKKKFSPDGLKRLFHTKLNLPPITKATTNSKGEKVRSVTLDATTLLKYSQRFPHAREPANLVIETEHLSKELSTWFNHKKADHDSRIRCKYGLTTDAGRFNSSENPCGTGYNLQNVKRSIRDMYVPDHPSFIFIKPDLSAAEDRVCKMIAAEGYQRMTGGSPDRMIWMANRKPWEADAHKESATFAFHCSEAEVTKAMRQTAKAVSHGSVRCLAGQKLADKLLLDSGLNTPDSLLIYTADQCQKMIDAYLESLYEIRDGYFPFIRQRLILDKALTNGWGRRWSIEDTTMDADLYRKAYSFNPQSEVRDLMSQWGIIPLYRHLTRNNFQARINADMHDGLLISSPPEEAYSICQFITQSLERPRTYYGRPLIIPVTITISRTWKGGIEFTRFPSEDDFDAAIATLFQKEV